MLDVMITLHCIVAGVKRLLMKLKSRDIYSGRAMTLFHLPNAQIRL